MAVISAGRARARADASTSDASTIETDVLRCVRRYGPRTGAQLECAVRGSRAELVDRLAVMVAAGVLRCDGRRFELREDR